MPAIKENGLTSWKHVGLYGHSVGMFTLGPEGVMWKSALESDSSKRNIPKSLLDTAQWSIFGRAGYLRIKTIDNEETAAANKNLPAELRFDGFPLNDYEELKDAFQQYFQIEVAPLKVSSAGAQYGLSKIKNKKLVFRHCTLEDANEEEGEEFEVRQDDEMLSLDLTEVSQCVLPGNNRNEIELQFPESDAVETSNDQLVSVRFYIPPDPDADPSDKTTVTNAEHLQQKIMKLARIRKTTGDVLVEFDLEKGSFLTPRGRYSIELYEHFFRMRGQKYDYKIKYDDISRLFLLPKPDDVHMAFVISLDKPIRQGQQRYQHLVLQTNKDQDEVTVNLDEETLQKEYGGDLQPVMKGSLSSLIAKTFKIIAKKKVFVPGKFQNANQQSCIKCALRANEGLLYPLEKQLLFIHKPPVLIRFNEVESIEFQRYAGGQGSTRNFDLCVTLKPSAVAGGGQNEYVFSGIDRSDYSGLNNFFSGKNIKILNISETFSGPAEDVAPVYNEDEIYGGPDDGEDEESEDEDYDAAAAAQDQEDEADSDASDEDMDSDDFGSEIDDDLDSDLEEARGGSSPAKKKKKKSSDSGDGDASPKKKKAKRKSDGGDEKPAKKKKAKKDPNAPKKALSAFMMFSIENRPKIKEANPEATFGEMGKLIGEAYKNISDEERARLNKKVEQDKERYAKEMANYTPPLSSPGGDDDGGGKKKAKAKTSPKPAGKKKEAPKKKAKSPPPSGDDDDSDGVDDDDLHLDDDSDDDSDDE
eukprot:CAMPEP_0113454940 /NCGR_PEP_ID=MMETSP0014_2-20120614/8121_1 /TAXON_ID=2857 /ORGANISM="Nitzschia sp." /LENGTH=754 /DNA_ID=CAMNT_0000346359 /DNA_START=65 /DNA_END=2329 /DNA_ORIENTATION=- /assembly_acc=CAM_ASM_000159